MSSWKTVTTSPTAGFSTMAILWPATDTSLTYDFSVLGPEKY